VFIDATTPVYQYVLAYGTATLDFEDVVSKRIPILMRYNRTEEAREFATRLANAWKTVIIRVNPTQVVTVDYSRPFSIDLALTPTYKIKHNLPCP